VALGSKSPFMIMITHTPANMFVIDAPDSALAAL
jgi:hypothetical protein